MLSFFLSTFNNNSSQNFYILFLHIFLLYDYILDPLLLTNYDGVDNFAYMKPRTANTMMTGWSEPGNYVCPKCCKSYAFARSWRRHVKYECGMKPRFQCPHCKIFKKQKVHVIDHIQRIHRGQRVYVLDHLKRQQ